jgi:hypothetical protein
MAQNQKTAPGLSRGTVKLLLDLIEIKLGCIEIYDREDTREVSALEKARGELSGLLGRQAPQPVTVRLAGAGEQEQLTRLRSIA